MPYDEIAQPPTLLFMSILCNLQTTNWYMYLSMFINKHCGGLTYLSTQYMETIDTLEKKNSFLSIPFHIKYKHIFFYFLTLFCNS